MTLLPDDGPDAPLDSPVDEELAGQDRPPPRWHRPAGLALGVLAVAAVVVLGVRAAGGDDPAPRPAATTSRVAVPPPVQRTFASPVTSPVQPVAAAVTAAFRGRDVEVAGYTTYPQIPGRTDYFFHVDRDLLTIVVSRLTPAGRESVERTASSVRLAQPLRGRYVDLTVRSSRGPTTARDFAALQQLVQDTRVLGR